MIARIEAELPLSPHMGTARPLDDRPQDENDENVRRLRLTTDRLVNTISRLEGEVGVEAREFRFRLSSSTEGEGRTARCQVQVCAFRTMVMKWSSCGRESGGSDEFGTSTICKCS